MKRDFGDLPSAWRSKSPSFAVGRWFAVLAALELELMLRPRSKGESAKLGDIF